MSRYTTPINTVPPIIPSGRLRSGRLISPAQSVAWYQPSQLPRTTTMREAQGGEQVARRQRRGPVRGHVRRGEQSESDQAGN